MGVSLGCTLKSYYMLYEYFGKKLPIMVNTVDNGECALIAVLDNGDTETFIVRDEFGNLLEVDTVMCYEEMEVID